MINFLSEKDTIDWLEKHCINNYHLVKENDKILVDVSNHVSLFDHHLDKIPVLFRNVDGDFSVSHNNLTSLKGCPEYIKGSFSCNSNLLNSLEFGPEYVGGGYDFCGNSVENFDFLAKYIGGWLFAGNNPLKKVDLSNTVLIEKFSHVLEKNENNLKINELANQYIYNQDIEMFELVLSKKDLEVIFLHKKLEKDIFNKNNKLKVKI